MLTMAPGPPPIHWGRATWIPRGGEAKLQAGLISVKGHSK